MNPVSLDFACASSFSHALGFDLHHHLPASSRCQPYPPSPRTYLGGLCQAEACADCDETWSRHLVTHGTQHGDAILVNNAPKRPMPERQLECHRQGERTETLSPCKQQHVRQLESLGLSEHTDLFVSRWKSMTVMVKMNLAGTASALLGLLLMDTQLADTPVGLLVGSHGSMSLGNDRLTRKATKETCESVWKGMRTLIRDCYQQDLTEERP